jgi:hypothetical protein
MVGSSKRLPTNVTPRDSPSTVPQEYCFFLHYRELDGRSRTGSAAANIHLKLWTGASLGHEAMFVGNCNFAAQVLAA